MISHSACRSTGTPLSFGRKAADDYRRTHAQDRPYRRGPACGRDIAALPGRLPSAQGLTFYEEELVFETGDTSLGGTVLVPHASGSKPGLVLVHGAGPHQRDSLRLEAEAFARRGIVTLIYDKRTEGYSQFERSHGQLADDALAARAALGAHPEVNPQMVGLWWRGFRPEPGRRRPGSARCRSRRAFQPVGGAPSLW